MPDLSFSDLNTALGGTVFSASGANITIDCSLLMGESAIALSDQKVAELLTRTLDACSKAQDTFNSVTSNLIKLSSYPDPFSGVPVFDSNSGNYFVSSTYSFSSRTPLNKAETTAVIA